MTDQHVASIDHPHDYVNAVQRLQELLGVAPDGLIGPVTRAAAAAVGFANREIVPRLVTIIENQEKIMATLADLQADVTGEDTVIDSAMTLIQGLAAQVAALAPNQAAIDKLAADIKAKSDALAAAVAANTPAATPPATP